MISTRPALVALAALTALVFLTSCKSSSKPAKLPKNLPKVNVTSSAASPPHRMSRGEYPFDARGNYVIAWAAEGDRQRRAGGYDSDSRADYSDWRDSHHENPAPASASIPAPVRPKKSSLFGRRSTGTSPAVAAATPPPQPPPAPSLSATSSTSAPVMVLSSTAPGGATTRITPSTTGRPSATASAVSSSPPKPVAATITPKTASSPSSSSSKPAASSSSSPPKKTTPKPASTPSTVTHTVKSGDTLYGIALRYKSTVAKIKAANGLKSDLIRPGQNLRVPR